MGLALLGCGVPKPTVRGRVTLDGIPVEKGAVQFFPEDKKSPSGKPGMIENGSYTAVGVPLGKVRVVINAQKVVGKRRATNLPNSPMVDTIEDPIPARYNKESTLIKEIQPGVNEIDFELTSK